MTALENAKVLETRNRDRDYAMRPFMDRSLFGNQRIVLRWVVASRDQFPNRSNMFREEIDEISKQQCYRESPYGKRFAVQNLGVAKEDLPMSEFTLEDESALHRYVNSKRKEAESQGVMFNFEVEGKAEMR